MKTPKYYKHVCQNHQNSNQMAPKSDPKSKTNGYLKSHEYVSKIMEKSMELVPRGSQNLPKWCPGALPKQPWKQVGPRLSLADTFWMLSESTWTILDAILGPSWAPRGSQNQAFWHQVVPKSQKLIARMGYQKKHDLSIESSSENVRF